MEPERRAAFLERLRQEESTPFTGWDFSRLGGRTTTTTLPWSFEGLASDTLRTSNRALDLGTGGGERLNAEIGAARGRVFATEGYAPNIPVARARLEPRGVRLVASNATELPFRDACFDVVTSSRTGFNVAEVARVLEPEGTLLTEQIDVGMGVVLREVFDLPALAPTDRRAQLVSRCERNGLRVERLETGVSVRSFSDVAALVYYLRAAPWIVPGFSVDAFTEPLLNLQERIEREGMLSFPRRISLLIARRVPGGRARPAHRK